MQTITCPSCGSPVPVYSSYALMVVCSHCHSTLERQDLDFRSIGKVAQQPDDLSPFQLYTEGKIDGLTFTIVGRLRQGWTDGFWNEWHVFVDDGQYGWLTEAQGELFLLWAEQATDVQSIDYRSLHPGQQVRIDGTTYIVRDMKQTTILSMEGELPAKLSVGSSSLAVDLVGPVDSFGTLDFKYANTPPDWFLGKQYTFEELHFSRLRELEGWKF